ncbi:MAG: hypothetical protein COA52_09700 [Hyphomicrobiales bacterium]|nr:MAG: hypothetical protein COA52_09700 [Hyphomicrobiales bacterium]
MNTEDQNKAASEIGLQSDMTGVPEKQVPATEAVPDPKADFVTRSEFEDLGHAFMSLQSALSNVHSEISQYRHELEQHSELGLEKLTDLETKLDTIVEHNRLKMPPVVGDRTKFAPPERPKTPEEIAAAAATNV